MEDLRVHIAQAKFEYHQTEMILPLALLALTTCLVSAVPYQYAGNVTRGDFFYEWKFISQNYDSPIDVAKKMHKGLQHYVDIIDAQTIPISKNFKGDHFVFGVSNSTQVNEGSMRYSVQLMSKNYKLTMGAVLMFDIYHVPYGCGVQPEIRTQSAFNLEVSPEITQSHFTIFRSANNEPSSHMVLFTGPTCGISNTSQSSTSTVDTTNCYDNIRGCRVTISGYPSHGSEFNNAGGGVFVIEYATTGISEWFIPRKDVPPSLLHSKRTLDSTDFGVPAAYWPAFSRPGKTNLTEVIYRDQHIVFDISLCAGLSTALYDRTCSGDCYLDNVVGNGTNFSEAYFEFGSIIEFKNYNDLLFNNIINGTSASITIPSSTSSTLLTSSSSSASDTPPPNPTWSTENALTKVSNKHSLPGIIAGSIGGLFLLIAVSTLLLYRKRKRNFRVSSHPSANVSEDSLTVVYNPMHTPPVPRTSNKQNAENLATEGEIMPYLNHAPQTTELLEELHYLRRQLADATGSVAGGTPPLTYQEGK